jgi:hypothetical protein
MSNLADRRCPLAARPTCRRVNSPNTWRSRGGDGHRELRHEQVGCRQGRLRHNHRPRRGDGDRRQLLEARRHRTRQYEALGRHSSAAACWSHAVDRAPNGALIKTMPFALASAPFEMRRDAPAIGQDSAAVLREMAATAMPKSPRNYIQGAGRIAEAAYHDMLESIWADKEKPRRRPWPPTREGCR